MNISELAKRMIIRMSIISGASVIGSILYYRSFGFLTFLLGAVIGLSASILKVILLERAVDKAITMEKDDAVKYITLHNILRLLVSGAALLIGAVLPFVELWGTVAGVLAFPFASYGERFRTKRAQSQEQRQEQSKENGGEQSIEEITEENSEKNSAESAKESTKESTEESGEQSKEGE